MMTATWMFLNARPRNLGAPDANPDELMEFTFEVALGEPQVARGEPLLEKLQSVVDLVDSLLHTFAPLLR